jgi:hypothetical protein
MRKRRVSRSQDPDSTLDDIRAEACEAARRRGTAEGKLLAKRRARVEKLVWEVYTRAFERFAEVTSRQAAGLRDKSLKPETLEVAEVLEDLGMAIVWVDKIADRYEKAHPELARPDPPAG